MTPPREPTSDECSQHAAIGEGWYAIWYPQMGGYVGKAAVKRCGSCFDVVVWHDGKFPFGEGSWREDASPKYLHHCDSDQFRTFADEVDKIMQKEQQ